MRSISLFHPNFFYAPRNVLGTTQLVGVKIYAMNPEPPSWVPGEDMSSAGDILIWEGHARVQPNKDWRSRPREVQYEYDAIQAVRVQLPIGKNLVGAVFDQDTNRYTSYGADPEFVKDMRVELVSGNVIGFENTIGKNLFIRNAVQNQNLWVYNLLCDTKTGGVDEVI